MHKIQDLDASGSGAHDGQERTFLAMVATRPSTRTGTRTIARSTSTRTGLTMSIRIIDNEGDADVAKQVIFRSREKYTVKTDAIKTVVEVVKSESDQKVVKKKRTVISQPRKQNSTISSEAKPLD